MGAATMADVARVAGVSKKTISNYFNGYPYIRPETRARIQAAVAELNYTLNVSARNLSSGRTGTIALAMPEIAHPYFAELRLEDVVIPAVPTAWDRGWDPELRAPVLEILGARVRHADDALYAPAAGEPTVVDYGPVTAIPYYRWANRTPGAMRVWIPTR
ncbi:LacI family DNA-binding transcriptional regulator [Microbacterium jejuense]|uniref:LacI family DNA-binding transcriptional regulator n=1 Tax=Microbacterium jejuense TaxID=1263637 RepID=UPI0031EA9B1B